MVWYSIVLYSVRARSTPQVVKADYSCFLMFFKKILYTLKCFPMAFL